MKAIADESEFVKLVREDALTVIDFYAKWCGPCKTIKPMFQKLIDKYPHVEFREVDIDNGTMKDICTKLSISSLPTFIVFKKGKIVLKSEGANLGEVVNYLDNN